MKLLEKFIVKNIENLHKNNVRLVFSGRKDRFTKQVIFLLDSAVKQTERNTGLTLNIAIDYGGQTEILSMVKKIAYKVKSLELNIDEITKEIIESNLYLPFLPPVDLMIRTGGEQRISNFMLWQLAFSELYFTEVCWPDFTCKDLQQAVQSYIKKDRSFGGINSLKEE